MSFQTAKKPTALEHMVGWAILLCGIGWGLAQCSAPNSTPSAELGKPSGGLDKISIRSMHYRTEAFDTVFIASFAIHNDNDYPIKDITVTCHHAAPSGSYIDKNARTVFERVSSRGYTYVRDFNMGFVAAQAVKTACIATGFSRA